MTKFVSIILLISALFLSACSDAIDPCKDNYLNDDGSLKHSDVNRFGNCKTLPRRCGDPLF